MDQIEYQNQQTLTHYFNSSIDNQLLKKVTKFLVSVSVTKFLVSVSVFSFCFSHSFLHSFNLFYFSKFPYQLFTHTIDKNCIFLLCNFLLVILAKYSGLIRSLSKSYCINDHETFKTNIIEGGSQYESPILLETEEPEFMHKELMVGCMGPAENVTAEEEKETGYFLMNQVDKDADKVVHEEYKEQKQEPESGVNVSPEDGILADEEDEQGNGVSTTEELNKKFDEFIRKMKEELRIEAQQQLIMV